MPAKSKRPRCHHEGDAQKAERGSKEGRNRFRAEIYNTAAKCSIHPISKSFVLVRTHPLVEGLPAQEWASGCLVECFPVLVVVEFIVSSSTACLNS